MGGIQSSRDIETLKEQALRQINEAKTKEELENLRISYLGRKGPINQFLRQLAQLDLETRRDIGSLANLAKETLTEAIGRRRKELQNTQTQKNVESAIDATLPGTPWMFGHRHPLTVVTRRILSVFKTLGFRYLEGSEIESDERNFTDLNISADHPARDMHDTLYLKSLNTAKGERLLLRTHTTPMQIHVMKKMAPPYRIVTWGKVFRREAIDATHLPVFHQIDAFHVDENVNMADLKATLQAWTLEMFGRKAAVRFRPSYFPFTEPSCEVEVACFFCHGQGCATCKNGWIEMLGAGMIHPHVLARQGRDPKRWKGFAFGLGVERVAMVLWGIPDIRLFYENQLAFLEQF